MTDASPSYPTSLRGVGAGFTQIVPRGPSTVSPYRFPVLAAALGPRVFGLIALASLVSFTARLLLPDVGAEAHRESDPM